MPLPKPTGAQGSADTTDRPPTLNETMTFKQSWIAWALPAVAALSAATAIAVMSLAPNFRARFGPIDDHEPLSWLDGAARLSLSDYFPTLLGRTEVGSFGETTRFRPAYYAIRVGLSVLAGDNPIAWYLVSVVAYVATAATLGYVTSMWLRVALGTPITTRKLVLLSLYAGLGASLFASMPSWSGVVTRLGPSELWALLGTSVAALALTHLAVGDRQEWWLPALLATSLAILSKENFAPLALATVAVGIYRSLLQMQSRHNIVWGALGLVPLGLLLAGVAPRLTTNQSDVYGQEIGTSRASSALEAVYSTYLFYWGPALFLLIFATLLLFWLPSTSSRLSALFIATLIIIWLTWLILDGVVYGGEYSLPRYWIVFESLKNIALLAVFPIGVAVATRSIGGLRLAGYVASAASLITIINATLGIPQSITNLRTESEANAAATLLYVQEVDAALDAAPMTESPSFLLIVHHDIDYEPVFALTTEILRSIPSARVHVDVSDPLTTPAVKGLSEVGNRERGLLPIEGLSRALVDVCIFINADPSAVEGCSNDLSFRVDARAM